jgi:hypothetical protein
MLECRRQLQSVLCDIEDDASPAGQLLWLQDREGHGNILLADAEDTADADYGGCILAIWPLQEPFDRAEGLTWPIVNSLVGVVAVTSRHPVAGRLGEKANWRGDAWRIGGADRLAARSSRYQRSPASASNGKTQ